MTARSDFVAKLVRLVEATPESLGDAFLQVGIVAHNWSQLRADERRRLRAAATGFSGLVEQRTSRATGTLYGIYDSVKQGVETPDNSPKDSGDWQRGRWQLKWTVVCETHHTCVCVASLSMARNAVAHPDFCDDCRENL